MYINSIDTPIGKLYVKVDEEYVYYIKWYQAIEDSSLKKYNNRILQKLRRQINEYFNGERQKFDLPLKLEGTIFQKKIWKAISEIPFGNTLSYLQLAKKTNFPNAFRAAGTACGVNPVSLVIPCHRVISSNRKLAGYGGGLEKKKWLLNFESNGERETKEI